MNELDPAVGTTARRTVRISAIYDLLVTAPFALPVTAPALFALLAELQTTLGHDGPAPTADPFTVMFANLMGSVVIVWAGYRILRPGFLAGAADIAARLLFSLGMATALAATGSPLVAAMLALELAWAAAQAWALTADRVAHHRRARAVAAPVAVP